MKAEPAFYDFEVFRHDWMVVFKTASGQIYKIHNDRQNLKETLKKFTVLIGYNNHGYDDLILAELLSYKIVADVYGTSQKIIDKEKENPKIKLNLPTIDVMQEIKSGKVGLGLKEIEANMKLNIHETPVDFNMKRKLFTAEVERVFIYCENDVNITEQVFNMRADYFQSKFEIMKEFGLDKMCMKDTRAKLSSKVLRCKYLKKDIVKKDRLLFWHAENLNFDNIPLPALNFYEEVKTKFIAGGDYEELEKSKFDYTLNGVPHKYGFGGLHGAVENLFYDGGMLSLDVISYYPSLMINNDFISRASESPELFKDLYKKRMQYKSQGDPKEKILKILLNATFGAMKSEWNPLFDPVMSNNICINGQLILTDLIVRLKNACKLIQSNTDGIIIAYDKKNLNMIKEIAKEWEENYNLKLDYDEIEKIVQKDVNNYLVKYTNGKIKAKGRFKNYQGPTYSNGSLTIIDMALTEYYMNGKDVDFYLIEQYKNDNLLPFQLIAKSGGSYIKMIHEIYDIPEDIVFNNYEIDELLESANIKEVDLQKINRLFATNIKKYGAVKKVKITDKVDENEIPVLDEDGKVIEVIRYDTVSNCPEHAIVHNEELEKFDKKLLDLNFYSELIKRNMIQKESNFYGS